MWEPLRLPKVREGPPRSWALANSGPKRDFVRGTISGKPAFAKWEIEHLRRHKSALAPHLDFFCLAVEKVPANGPKITEENGMEENKSLGKGKLTVWPQTVDNVTVTTSLSVQ